MAKPREKTGSTAPRQIAPPPLSQHLRELASQPHAWGVLGRDRTFLKGVPIGIRGDARQRAEAAGAVGCVSPNPAGDGNVHNGRPRSRLHSGAADGAVAELFRDLARARARCSLRRSVAVVRIRSGRSCVQAAPTLTATAASSEKTEQKATKGYR